MANTTPGIGQSWGTAYDNLDDALAWAALVTPTSTKKEIWVAQGIYKPTSQRTPGDNLSISFSVPRNTHLYGGFAGNENATTDRPGNLYTSTILQGQLTGFRVRHVVYCEPIPQGAAEHARIDGFRIVNGFAFGVGPNDNQGGGIYARLTSLLVANCEFADNLAGIEGGAIYWENDPNHPIGNAIGMGVSRSRFVSNIALTRGGAIYSDRPVRINGVGDTLAVVSHIVNCEFDSNEAGRSNNPATVDMQGGGAVYFFNPEAQVLGNVFSYNSVKGKGSAMQLEFEWYASGIQPVPLNFDNNTFYGNESIVGSGGGGLIHSQSQPANASHSPVNHNVWNSIAWGNTMMPLGGTAIGVDHFRPLTSFAAEFSDLELDALIAGTMPSGVWPSIFSPPSNLNTDPLFVAPLVNDFRLANLSPCINSGADTSFGHTIVDIADVNVNMVWQMELHPYALDVPGNFFKAPNLGVARYQGPCVTPADCLDMGALERQ